MVRVAENVERSKAGSLGVIMSAWRKQALEKLPECRRLIEAADSPMALWIELLGECQDASRNQAEDLICRFYEFARCCWQSPSADVRTAVACAFYEHLPTTPELRRDMPRRFAEDASREGADP